MSVGCPNITYYDKKTACLYCIIQSDVTCSHVLK